MKHGIGLFNFRCVFILLMAVFGLPSWAIAREMSGVMSELDPNNGKFTISVVGLDVDVFFDERHDEVFRDNKFHTIGFFDNARGSWCYKFYIEQWNNSESRIIDDIKVCIKTKFQTHFIGVIANTSQGEITNYQIKMGLLEHGGASGEYLLYVSQDLLQEGIEEIQLDFKYFVIRPGLFSVDKFYDMSVKKSVDQGLDFTYTPMPTNAQFSVTNNGLLKMDVSDVPGHSQDCYYSWMACPLSTPAWSSAYNLHLNQNGTGWDANVDINSNVSVTDSYYRFSPKEAYAIRYRGYMMGDKYEFREPYSDGEWAEATIPAYLYPIHLEAGEYDQSRNEVKISWQAQRTYSDVINHTEGSRSTEGKWHIYREYNGMSEMIGTLDGTCADSELNYTDIIPMPNVEYTYRVVFIPQIMQDNADEVLTWFESDLQPTVTVKAKLTSGTCGDNATWALTQDAAGNYTRLTISGSGAMYNYDHTTVDGLWRTTAPWGWELTSVTIGDEITSIGEYAFVGCQQLSELSLGNGVTSIGASAFDHCDGFTEVNLPANVNTLAVGVFKNCVNLQRVNIMKSDGLVSLTGGSVFDGCHSDLVLVPPTPALYLQYKTAENWSNYASKVRLAFGNYYFTATDEGGTAAYAIANDDDLLNFASAVNAGNNGSGFIFRQTADITLTGTFTPIGYGGNLKFSGTYDGGNYTISGLEISNYGKPDLSYLGLFGQVWGGTVKNVRLVSPTVTSGSSYNKQGALIGYAGSSTVDNCVVISPNINIYASNSFAGAVIGRIDSGTVLTNLYFYDAIHNYAGLGTNNSSSSNVVYRARKVTFNDGITATPDANDIVNGFVYNGESYYREGIEISLIFYSEEFDIKFSYTVGEKTTELEGDILTVPTADITVSATFTVKKWDGSGTVNDPYCIAFVSQLNALADSVNSGINYAGVYFKLVADLNYDTKDLSDTESNYTPIGRQNHSFFGHFDGANHVVSGIRLYKGGSDFEDFYQGLFGIIGAGASVSYVFLSDARITGYQHVGGIVGCNNGGTVTGCYVLKDVTINSVKSFSLYHGGLVGSNMNGGIVSYCTAGADVNCADGLSYCQCYGGVVGENENATVESCLYTGKTVNGNSYVGAVIGNNCGFNSSVEFCYYISTTITGIDGDGNTLDNAVCAVGENSDKSPNPENIGQLDYHGLAPKPLFTQMAPQDSEDNNVFIALMARRAAALKAAVPQYDASVTLTLRGRTLNRDGKWRTVCLPFDVVLEGSIIEGAEARELISASIIGTTLNLEFSDPVEKLVAGTPYIIRLGNEPSFAPLVPLAPEASEAPLALSASEAPALSDPTFANVNIDDTDRSFDNAESGNLRVRFVGSYKMNNFDDALKSTLLVNGTDNPCYPTAGTNMGAFRAHFMIGDGDSEGAVSITDFNIKLGDGEYTRTVDNAIPADRTLRKVILNTADTEAPEATEWYDLNGRKLDGKPSRTGVYIRK